MGRISSCLACYGLGCVMLALAGCDISQVAAAPDDDATGGPGGARPIDVASLHETFREGFDAFDVSAWGPGTKWIAHTPWHGDFGDAAFADPEPGFPFQTARGILRIEARKDDGGHWQSGLIASRDHDGSGGTGFAQRYGYFEVEAKLPEGTGVWPAFWLVGVTDRPRAEIDVFEFYGNAPRVYRANVHVWSDDASKFDDGKSVAFPADASATRFNRYGVEIDHDWVTFYLNRRSVWRTPTRPEFRQPMYMLADLALGSGWPIDKVADPTFMYIRSIVAYERRR